MLTEKIIGWIKLFLWAAGCTLLALIGVVVLSFKGLIKLLPLLFVGFCLWYFLLRDGGVL